MGVHLYVVIYRVITDNNILTWRSPIIWVDSEWNLQKKIIVFSVFDEKHIASNICRLIKVIVEEHSLINKIFAIYFDNAYANAAFISELENVC